jgi:hypothetical protein
MNAIEFSAKIKNGVIKIPQQYLQNVQNGDAKIIVLMREKSVMQNTNIVKRRQIKKNTVKRKFKALSLDTKGFKFSRKEANER